MIAINLLSGDKLDGSVTLSKPVMYIFDNFFTVYNDTLDACSERDN